MIESRKNYGAKESPLPIDYLKMAAEVMTNHFGESLAQLENFSKNKKFAFRLEGSLFHSEAVLAAELVQNQDSTLQTSEIHRKITFVASTDFDPEASMPKAEQVLAACFDGLALVWESVFEQLFSKQNLGTKEQDKIGAFLLGEIPEGLDNFPWEWSEVAVAAFPVFIKFDPVDLSLEKQTQDWLEANDPDFKAGLDEEQKETEEKFMTGKKTVH